MKKKSKEKRAVILAMMLLGIPKKRLKHILNKMSVQFYLVNLHVVVPVSLLYVCFFLGRRFLKLFPRRLVTTSPHCPRQHL